MNGLTFLKYAGLVATGFGTVTSIIVEKKEAERDAAIMEERVNEMREIEERIRNTTK